MELIRKLQLVETEMLRQWDTVCRKYGIEYFIIFGTALGAVRHHGFIPWDDDIDIGLLRKDFEKIKTIPEEEWNGYQIQGGEADCFYHEKVFPRMFKPGTIFEPETWVKYVDNPQNIKKPVWMDIFLFDYVDSKKDAQKTAKRASIIKRQYYFAKYKTNIISNDQTKKKIQSAIKCGLHYWFRLFHKPDYYLQKYYELVCKEKGKYIISYDPWKIGTIMDTFAAPEMYFPPKRMKFEDIDVLVPNDIEGFLKQRFGDYTLLPPKEQQKAHMPKNLRI